MQNIIRTVFCSITPNWRGQGKEQLELRVVQIKDTVKCEEPALEAQCASDARRRCEKESPTSELRQAMTMQLGKRLNECARNLNDGKFLARLSGGDVVAQELRNNYSCLTALYNKERAYFLTIENQEGQTSQEKEAYPLVFTELHAYTVETQTSSDGPPKFRLDRYGYPVQASTRTIRDTCTRCQLYQTE